MEHGYYGEMFASQNGRDVATREGAKLSLTDTMAMLRARGQDSMATRPRVTTTARTCDPPRQDIVGNDDCRTDDRDLVTGVTAPPYRRDDRVLPLPSLRRSMDHGETPRLFTLADTITLSKPRVQRPSTAQPILKCERDAASPCCPEESSSESRGNRQSDCGDSEQCCAGPECAARPRQRAWPSEDGSIEPSLNTRRHERQISHSVPPTLPFQPSRSRPPASARSSQVIARDIFSGSQQSCSSPEFTIRELRRRATTLGRAQSGQGHGDLRFSAADEFPLTHLPRNRTTVTGRSSDQRSMSINELDDDDEDNGEDDRPTSNVLGLDTNGMTPEQIRQAKKDRRKEQCRINQANYRKRKRAVEKKTDSTIQKLQDEIDRLEVQRDTTRRRMRDASESARQSRDPMKLVHQVFLRLSPTQDMSRQMRAPLRQVDAIVGLGYEEFGSVDELLAQWKYHRTVFDVFDLRLRCVRSEQLGEMLVLAAEATLRCSIVAGPHTRHGEFREQGNRTATVECPVVQRYVFDTPDHALAKIISEVDWLAGLRGHSAAPLALVASLVP